MIQKLHSSDFQYNIQGYVLKRTKSKSLLLLLFLDPKAFLLLVHNAMAFIQLLKLFCDCSSSNREGEGVLFKLIIGTD